MRTLRIVCVLLLAWLPWHVAHARGRAVTPPFPLLSLSAIEPSSGPIAGGTAVTIRGSGFLPARAAPFDLAGADIAVDTDGSVLVIEPDRLVVRKIAPDGTCTRFAGRGFNLTPVEAEANDIGDGRPATDAAANGRGITIGPDGNVYLAEIFFHRIRRIDRQTGIIQTVAGSGPITYHGGFAGDGGPAMAARLDQPNQVAFDGSGNMYILDAFNYRIRRVTPNGIINTIAGNGTPGFSGDGGPATLASFNTGPNGDAGALKVDRDGNVLFTDVENRRIRKIDVRTGTIATIVGGGSRDDEGAPATDTRVQGVQGIAVAADGTTYFSDASRIRRIGSDGRVTTLFGELTPGFSEDGVRSGRLAALGRILEGHRCLAGPLASDPAGRVYVYCSNGQIMRIDGRNNATVVGATSNRPGFNGDGGASAQAETRNINGMAIDRFGNVYLMD